MTHWNSSPHPISDIRDWSKAGRLELRPDFQRREVWSAPAKIMLMDSILRGIPMPKIFLANADRDFIFLILSRTKFSALISESSDFYSVFI